MAIQDKIYYVEQENETSIKVIKEKKKNWEWKKRSRKGNKKGNLAPISGNNATKATYNKN